MKSSLLLLIGLLFFTCTDSPKSNTQEVETKLNDATLTNNQKKK